MRRAREVRPEVLAAMSGVLLGLGATVLLQQYAVWILDVWRLVVLPLAVGGASAAVVWVLRQRSGGAT